MTSQNSSKIIITAGIVLLIGLASLAFFQFFEWKEQTVEIPPTGEARINPYLAGCRLLEKFDHKVTKLTGLSSKDGLPPKDGLLILPVNRSTFTEQRNQELLDWVDQGGHLMVVARHREDKNFNLFKEFLSRQRETEKEGSKDEDTPEEAPEDALDDGLDTTEVMEDRLIEDFGIESLPMGKWGNVSAAFSSMDQSGESLKVYVRTRFRLEDNYGNARWFFGDEDGYLYLGLTHGNGLISIMADDDHFTNKLIGEEQNASFFLHAANLWGVPSETWFVFRESYKSLWMILAEKGKYAFVVMALLIFFWIWHKAPRLGPILPDPPTSRRSLMEHINAAGEFLWQRFMGEHMVAATREAMMNRVRMRYPHWLALSPEELKKTLHERTSIPHDRIDEALESGAVRKSETLTRIIQTIETIRRTL